MPTPNPFEMNDPITPAPTPPLSGQAHRDIDSFATITQVVNPDGTMPDGSSRRPQVSKQFNQTQPGVPAYQKSPNKPLGKL
jgi:hypothetical protein